MMKEQIMKCQKCGAETDDEIEIDEWYYCPICHTSMFGFRDDMLDIGVNELMRDVRSIEKRLMFLSRRLRELNKK